MMNDPLSFTIGASSGRREEINPIPPEAPKRLLFPSLIFTSNTEEALPPYSAGIPDLYRDASLMASELKTEKKPSR